MSKIGVYYQTWSSSWTDTADKFVSSIPDHVSIVYFAFANPNMTYTKGSFSGTGLEFNFGWDIAVAGIKQLRAKGITCMLSVGGATYSWDTYNVNSIIDLTLDLGLNGIDIDWEPATGTSASFQLAPIIQTLHQTGPTLKLCLCAWSVGANVGQFSNDPPQGSMYAGMDAPGIMTAGSMLDWINVMSYDAGPTYDGVRAYKAYRNIYNGPIHLGLEVGVPGWGGYMLNKTTVQNFCNTVNGDNIKGGVFIWALQKQASDVSVADCISIANGIFGGVSIPIPTSPPPTTTPDPVTPVDKEWQANTAYNVGNFVTSGGQVYMCKEANTNVQPGVTYWVNTTTGPSNPQPTGDTTWQAWVPYKVGQVVSYNGTNYVCIQGHTSQPDWTPYIVASLWKKQ